MKTVYDFPFPHAWDAQALADAFPRRLRVSQMIDVNALRAPATGVPHARSHAWAGSSHAPGLPLFRIS